METDNEKCWCNSDDSNFVVVEPGDRSQRKDGTVAVVVFGVDHDYDGEVHLTREAAMSLMQDLQQILAVDE
jgi:hypothetical protein